LTRVSIALEEAFFLSMDRWITPGDDPRPCTMRRRRSRRRWS